MKNNVLSATAGASVVLSIILCLSPSGPVFANGVSASPAPSASTLATAEPLVSGDVTTESLLPQTLTPIPTITGVLAVGQTLTADPGTWDVDVTLGYQWFHGAAVITGAIEPTYTVTSADLGTLISVQVTGSKTDYEPATMPSIATSAILRGTLTLTPLPTIGGEVAVGKTVTALPGTWDEGVVFSYRWYRNSVAIGGATSNTYTLVMADFGKTITVKVTGAKTSYFSSSQTSAATGSVTGAALTRTPTPTISGSLKVGQVLTATAGTWDTGVTLKYRWYRAGNLIAGATRSTYQLTAVDYHSRIVVAVVGSKLGYVTFSSPSSATTPIAKGTYSTSPIPSITGTMAVGNTLSASTSGWTPNPTQFSYQWLRNGSPIDYATSSSYRLTTDDAGQGISIRVQAITDGFAAVQRTSARINSWTRTTLTATYTAWSVFSSCRSYGDSYSPCSPDSFFSGPGGVRLYSSGYGDVMVVAASLPTQGAVQRFRLTFNNATSYNYDGHAFIYAATNTNPNDTNAWNAQLAFPTTDFSDQNFTTPWSTGVTGSQANFVIGCLGWQSLYVQSITIEYETIL